MTIKDFTSRELSQPYAGTLMEITTNASFVTLWAHRPRFNMEGKLQHERGTVLTKRWPREDYPGLYKHAQNGFFPWPVDADPDLSAFPGNSKQFIDSRKEVLKAYEAYTERYGTETEPMNSSITFSGKIYAATGEGVQEISEPAAQLPESVFEPEPVEEKSFVCGIDGCTYEPGSKDRNDRKRTDKARTWALDQHKKSKLHAQVATA